ncbi:MAG: diphthamide synthesis protein [Candidatus Pacearchaeota archaeon]
MEYDLELKKIIKKIKKQKVSRVLIQLPEGLKSKAIEIADKIEKETKSKVFIWIGSCYGACDLPQGTENLGIDLIIQFGHSAWPFWSSKKLK